MDLATGGIAKDPDARPLNEIVSDSHLDFQRKLAIIRAHARFHSETQNVVAIQEKQ